MYKIAQQPDTVISAPAGLVQTFLKHHVRDFKFQPYELCRGDETLAPDLFWAIYRDGKVGVIASIITGAEGCQLYGCEFESGFYVLGINDFYLVDFVDESISLQ